MRPEVERTVETVVDFLSKHKEKRVSLARLRQLIFRAHDRLIRISMSVAVERGQAKVVYRDVWAHPSYVIPAEPDYRIVKMNHIRKQMTQDNKLVRYLTKAPRNKFDMAAFLDLPEHRVAEFMMPYIGAKLVEFNGSFYSIVDRSTDCDARLAI